MLGRWLCRTSALAFLACTAIRPPLYSQINWGSIQGSVTDLSGAAVPGASITAVSNTFPRGVSTTTDERGLYALPVLPVGIYAITVVAPGFHTLRYHNIEISIGAKIAFNARLSLGAVTESIEINESLHALQASSSQKVTTITASEFDNVARGRSFHTILMMAPGVRQETKAGAGGVGGISVDGSSGSENAYFIDGVEVSDILSGALRAQNSIPLEFVNQVQIKSGGFEAEFGGATGGVISVATRGGSNQIHGELTLQATSGRWNASDRGYYQRASHNADLAEFLVPRKDSYRILYPGGAVGGPLLRDRLFGFVSYMPEAESTRRTIDYTIDGVRTYRSDRIRHYGIARLDYSPLPGLQLNASWVWSPARRTGGLPVRDPRLRAPANDMSILGEYVPSQSASVAGTYSPSSRMLLSARYGYKYLNSRTSNYGVPTQAYINYRTPSWSADGVPEVYAGAAGNQSNLGSFSVEKDIASRQNLYIDSSRVSTIFGQQHILKTGYALNRIYNDISDGYANGRFDIFWGESFSRGSVAATRGRYGYYIWEDGPRHNSRALGHNHGVYVQDTWRVHPSVTINAGLRLERESLPPYRSEANGVRVQNPIAFGWGDKLAPRLGGAWDIGGRGRWKVSGSYGLFYDLMKYSLAREAFGGDYWVSHVYRLDHPQVLELSLKAPDRLGQKITSYDNRMLRVNAQGQLAGIDPGLSPYTSRELSVALDHQLTSRLQIGVRYTRKQLLRAIEDIGILDENDNEVYLVGNPGFGLTRDPASAYGGRTPNHQEYLVPKARRDYDALEWRLEGQLQRFHLLGSYTLSRLYGNYAGLANSDEAGRMEPSISRSFDLPTYYFDSSGRQQNIEGRLATDRPHVFKVFGWRELRHAWGATNVGISHSATSGGLESTTVGYLTAPTFPFGRGDLGRLPVFTQTDINLTHTLSLSERVQLKFEATAMNVLNQAAVIARVTQINRQGNITRHQLPLEKFFSGYRLTDYVYPGSQTPYNPVYGLPGGDPMDGGVIYRGGKGDLTSAFIATNPGFGAYQGPRSLRLGLRLTF